MGRKILEEGLFAHCDSRSHVPPLRLTIQPGVYVYTCPDCRRTVEVTTPPRAY